MANKRRAHDQQSAPIGPFRAHATFANAGAVDEKVLIQFLGAATVPWAILRRHPPGSRSSSAFSYPMSRGRGRKHGFRSVKPQIRVLRQKGGGLSAGAPVRLADDTCLTSSVCPGRSRSCRIRAGQVGGASRRKSHRRQRRTAPPSTSDVGRCRWLAAPSTSAAILSSSPTRTSRRCG